MSDVDVGTQEYVVLRLDGGSQQPEKAEATTSATLEGAVGRRFRTIARDNSAGRNRGRPKITVQASQLSPRQLANAKRDPRNVVALPMPVTLLAPIDSKDHAQQLSDAAGAAASWGISVVGADRTDLNLRGLGVRVAVLDTGIDLDHPAFASFHLRSAKAAKDLKDFTGGETVLDGHGHGTHCAGTIAGADVGGVRIGIARAVDRLIVGKVLDDYGRGSTKSVLDALVWAARDRKAHVISMSLGFDFVAHWKRLLAEHKNEQLAAARALAAYRDCLLQFSTLFAFLSQEGEGYVSPLIVAAAGNESNRPSVLIEAALPGSSSDRIITVGAIDSARGVAEFSNASPRVVAPGVGIVSAEAGTGHLRAMTGTSMAAPHVTGIAALWWEFEARRNERVKAGDIADRIIGKATRRGFSHLLREPDVGSGLAVAPTPDD